LMTAIIITATATTTIARTSEAVLTRIRSYTPKD
jgi:hypothetical protein